MKETLSLRTKTSRTYDLGGGKHRIVIDPTLTVQPGSKDTQLYSGDPDASAGDDIDVWLQDHPNIIRGIFEYDISGLPAEVTLDSASLQLYYRWFGNLDPVGKTVWAYKLTRTDWVELEATWNSYKTGSAWTTPGGDYVTSAPAGGSTTFPASFGWMTWNVLAIVQDAYDGSIPAEFLVKFETEGLAEDYSSPRFWTKESADSDLYPKLVIDYTVPIIELAGLASGICSVSGSLIGIWTLRGVAAGVASVTGFTSIARKLAGITSGICSTAADLWVGLFLKGLSAGASQVVGSLPIARKLAGAAAGIASVTARLQVWVLLKGLSAGVATVTGSLFHVRVAIRVLDAVRNLLAVRNIPPVR